MDIVKRLRNLGGKGNEDYNPPWVVEMTRKAHRDAADEIERLREALVKLLQRAEPAEDYIHTQKMIIAISRADIEDMSVLIPNKPRFSDGRQGGLLG